MNSTPANDSEPPHPPPSNPLDNPLQALARHLKIDGIFVTIPAVPKIGLHTPTNIGLIYLLLVGILYLFFDYKAIVFALIMFVVYKNSNNQA